MRYRAIFTGVYSGLPSPSDDDCRVRRSPSGTAHSFIVPPGQIHYDGGNKMICKPASISPDLRLYRMALMLCGFLLVSTIFSPPGGADQPTNKALVTDRANLLLSDQFAPPGQIRLTDSGEVFFVPGGSAFFRWSSGS